MRKIDPYLTFNGNCLEAMSFYKECFGGELEIMIVKDTPMASQMPPESQNKVLHSALRNGSFLIMASEMMGSEGFVSGNNVSLSIDCKSEEEMKTFFTYFSEGGNVFCPIRDEFWGAKFAAVTDKFGTSWLLNYDKNTK